MMTAMMSRTLSLSLFGMEGSFIFIFILQCFYMA